VITGPYGRFKGGFPADWTSKTPSPPIGGGHKLSCIAIGWTACGRNGKYDVGLRGTG
jgi:hypothetical protein